MLSGVYFVVAGRLFIMQLRVGLCCFLFGYIFYSTTLERNGNSNESRLHLPEGPWDDVMRVIGQAHSMLHANGVVRIQSDIRVGSRTDKKQTAQDKVDAVNRLLGQDGA